jgi:hypothetical protein
MHLNLKKKHVIERIVLELSPLCNEQQIETGILSIRHSMCTDTDRFGHFTMETGDYRGSYYVKSNHVIILGLKYLDA